MRLVTEAVIRRKSPVTSPQSGISLDSGVGPNNSPWRESMDDAARRVRPLPVLGLRGLRPSLTEQSLEESPRRGGQNGLGHDWGRQKSTHLLGKATKYIRFMLSKPLL